MNRFFFVLTCSYSLSALAQWPGPGNTLEFDGLTTKVEHGELYSDLELPVTLEGWFKVSSQVGTSRRVFFGTSFHADFYSGVWASISTRQMAVAIGDGSGRGNGAYKRAITDFETNVGDRWVHIAMVIDENFTVEFYLNGIKLPSSYDGNSTSAMATTGTCIVGNNILNNFFHGQIDELRLWNTTRSQEEIRSNMCRKIANDVSDLIGYWNFDENSGNQAQESISKESGVITGDYEWATSGAGVGDSSSFVYFNAGRSHTKVATSNDSVWLHTAESVIQGYQLYHVSEFPNSSTGSTLSFDHGYYGLFPIFNEIGNDYWIDFGDKYCTESNFRNGNDDMDWEVVSTATDTSIYLTTHNISEILFDRNGTIEPIGEKYLLCPGQSVTINAESSCATSYNWFNSSSDSEITISEPGIYWLERTTPFGPLIEPFEVEEIQVLTNLLIEEEITLCSSDLPLTISTTASENIEWNDGTTEREIRVNSAGTYWIEQETNCGLVRDSVFVSVIELEDPFIPNVITPNSDELNDCFQIDPQLLGSSLTVVNRAGVEIFKDLNYQNDWCPMDLPSGVYYYLIRSKCTQKSIKGWLQLIY